MLTVDGDLSNSTRVHALKYIGVGMGGGGGLLLKNEVFI